MVSSATSAFARSSRICAAESVRLRPCAFTLDSKSTTK